MVELTRRGAGILGEKKNCNRRSEDYEDYRRFRLDLEVGFLRRFLEDSPKMPEGNIDLQ